MEIRPICDGEDYEKALKVAARLVDADPAHGTREVDQLEALATLTECYEAERFPLDLSGASEAIKIRMEQAGP